MTRTILIIGRSLPLIDDIITRVQTPDIRLLGGETIDDVKSAFASHSIDHVIVGGGIDLERRIEIVREVFHLSSSTTVHMNSPSGPESFPPFVQSVLSGVKNL